MRNRVATGLWVIAATLVWLAGSLPLQAQSLPRPQQFAGFPIGSDGNLVRWDRIVEYMRRAGATSDRILVEEIGKTTLDNPFLVVTVSSARNLARLDQIKAVQRRLAYPYDLSEAEAERLAWESPAVLLITLNIHLPRSRVLAGAGAECVEGFEAGRVRLPRVAVEDPGGHTAPGGFWHARGGHGGFWQ